MTVLLICCAALLCVLGALLYVSLRDVLSRRVYLALLGAERRPLRRTRYARSVAR